jgi:hypothetical protein
MFSVLGSNVFPPKEASINRPRTGPDHCNGAPEGRQNEGNPRITEVAHGDPEFDYSNQRPYDWGPEAEQEKYRQPRTNDLRNHRRRKGCPREIDDSKTNEQEASDHSLEQETYTRPAIGEGRKQSLQECLP